MTDPILVHIGHSPTLCGIESHPREWPKTPVLHGQVKLEAAGSIMEHQRCPGCYEHVQIDERGEARLVA